VSEGAGADRPPWAPKSPVLVIGDFCQDRFIRAAASRVSRERPLPVFSFGGIEDRAGGAGNVARQLRAYGVRAVEVELATCVKLRVLAGAPEAEVFRLDYPWRVRRLTPVRQNLAAIAGQTFAAIVYVDYRGLAGPPAVLAPFLVGRVCPRLVDARASIKGWHGFDVLKVNVADAGLPRPVPVRVDFDWVRWAADVPAAVVTRGAAGYAVATAGRVEQHPAADVPGPVQNVSGAGDVFTATLAAYVGGAYESAGRYAAEAMFEAAEVANVAAGLRVRAPAYNVAVGPQEIAKWLPSGPQRA